MFLSFKIQSLKNLDTDTFSLTSSAQNKFVVPICFQSASENTTYSSSIKVFQDTDPNNWACLVEVLNKHFTAPLEDSHLQPLLKLLEKMCKGFASLSYYSKHEDLHEGIYKLLNAKEVASFLDRVLVLQKEGGAFNDFNSTLKDYNDLVKEVKSNLFKEYDPKAITWNKRSSFLFFWCNILIEETLHPALQPLRKTASTTLETKAPKESSVKTNGDLVKAVVGVCTQFVLPLTCVDDIADEIRDSKLLVHFTKFPPEDCTYEGFVKTDISDLVKDVPETYANFFKFYVNQFKNCIDNFCKIVGEEAVKDHWGVIVDAWKVVMDCLAVSASKNERLDNYGKDLNSVNKEEDDSAQNMLMSFFMVLQNIVIDVYKISNPNNNKKPLTDLLTKGEVAGHSANHIATFDRELGNGDFSNVFIELLTNRLNDSAKLYKKDFRATCSYLLTSKEVKISSSPSSSPRSSKQLTFSCIPSHAKNFVELLLHLRNINKNIMDEIQDLVEEAQKKTGKGTDLSINIEAFLKGLSEWNSLSLLVDNAKELFKGARHLKDLEELVNQKRALIQLINSLLEKTNMIQVGLTRLSTELEDIDKLAEKLPVKGKEGVSSYVAGIHRLCTMYLLFKSSL